MGYIVGRSGGGRSIHNGNAGTIRDLTIEGTFNVSGIIQSGAALVFEGESINDYQTTFFITDPIEADRTITFPDANILVNDAGTLTGVTLASGVLSSSLTSVGALENLTMGGDIAMGSNNITGTGTIGGTLTTEAQTNITSLGTLTGLTMGGALAMGSNNITGTGTIGGTITTAAQTNITSLGTLTGLTMGGALAMGSNNITGTGTIGGTITTAAQTNITSLGTLTGLTMGGNLTIEDSWARIYLNADSGGMSKINFQHSGATKYELGLRAGGDFYIYDSVNTDWILHYDETTQLLKLANDKLQISGSSNYTNTAGALAVNKIGTPIGAFEVNGDAYISGQISAITRLAVGSSNVTTSADLALHSTSRGFLPNVLSTSEMNAISSPATGLHIWNEDLDCLMVYNSNSIWQPCGKATYKFDMTAYSTTNYYPIVLDPRSAKNNDATWRVADFELTSTSAGKGATINQCTIYGRARGGGWTDASSFVDIYYRQYDPSEEGVLAIYRGTENFNGIVIYVCGGVNWVLKSECHDVSIKTAQWTSGSGGVNDSTFTIKDVNNSDSEDDSGNNVYQMHNCTYMDQAGRITFPNYGADIISPGTYLGFGYSDMKASPSGNFDFIARGTKSASNTIRCKGRGLILFTHITGCGLSGGSGTDPFVIVSQLYSDYEQTSLVEEMWIQMDPPNRDSRPSNAGTIMLISNNLTVGNNYYISLYFANMNTLNNAGRRYGDTDGGNDTLVMYGPVRYVAIWSNTA